MNAAAPARGQLRSYDRKHKAAKATQTAVKETFTEVSFELAPTKGADLALVVTSPDDVFPSERSEMLSRA